MLVNPPAWNVVVVGAWNRAILTPAGIQRRLFGLTPATPVEIEVAIDRPAPFRVKHKGLVVTVGSESLIVETQVARTSELNRAADLARKALQELPETPVFAAGLNMALAYSGTPDPIAKMFESSLDEALADQSCEVAGRSIRRTVKLDVGQLNMDLAQRDDAISLVLNFHFTSEDAAELANWLSHAQEYCSRARSLVRAVFHQPIDQESSDDPN